MAAQTLYLRSTQSGVVTGTTTCKLLSTTQGGSATTGTTVKQGTGVNTWQFIPGTAGNTATIAPGTTPNTKGFLFDGSAAGTYTSGTWTVQIEQLSSTTTGTDAIKASLWVVTATSTTVTSVSQLANAVATSTYTNSTTKAAKTLTFSPGAVTLTAGQYLYLELYLTCSVASSSSTCADTLELDDTGVSASSIVTPSFALVTLNGALTQTLGNSTLSAVGTNKDHSALGVTLAALTRTSVATNTNHARLGITLNEVTETSVGTNTNHGRVASLLGNSGSTSAGTNTNHGALTHALSAGSVAGAATTASHASTALPLEPVVPTSSSQLQVAGTISASLDPGGLITRGTMLTHGTLQRTLESITELSGSTDTTHADATPVLAALTCASMAQLRVVAQASSLEALHTLSSHGSLGIQADSTILLDLAGFLQAQNLVEAQGSTSLEDGGVVATATLASPAVQATVVQGLFALQPTMHGTVQDQASVSLALTPLELLSTGVLVAGKVATLSCRLANLTQAANGQVALQAGSTGTLPAFVQMQGRVMVQMLAQPVLGGLQCQGQGTVQNTVHLGRLQQQLRSIRVRAQGQTPVRGMLARTVQVYLNHHTGVVYEDLKGRACPYCKNRRYSRFTQGRYLDAQTDANVPDQIYVCDNCNICYS